MNWDRQKKQIQDILTTKQLRRMYMRIGLGMSYQEIGDAEGISKQSAWESVKLAERRVKK